MTLTTLKRHRGCSSERLQPRYFSIDHKIIVAVIYYWIDIAHLSPHVQSVLEATRYAFGTALTQNTVLGMKTLCTLSAGHDHAPSRKGFYTFI